MLGNRQCHVSFDTISYFNAIGTNPTNAELATMEQEIGTENIVDLTKVRFKSIILHQWNFFDETRRFKYRRA